MWGAIGALAPEICRRYNIITTGAPSSSAEYSIKRFFALLFYGIGYVVVSLFFLALGGAIAVAWGDDSHFKCFMIGAGTPVMISFIINQLPKMLPDMFNKPPNS
jgi:hypothetical protein